MTEKLEAEKPVKKNLFYLLDDEVLKMNRTQKELNIRKITVVTENPVMAVIT